MSKLLTFLILIGLLLSPVLYSQDTATPPEGTAVEGSEGSEGETEEETYEVSKIQSFLAPFIYDRERFRDPFEAQGSAAPLDPGQVYGPFLEVQQHRLSDFKLKGLLWRTANPVAVFVSPENREFRLGIKDYIGENFGYIASIREKEVVIIQTIEENEKRYSTTKVVFLNE